MDLVSMLANLVMALAAGYGVISWRLGRRVENSHDAALAVVKAALGVSEAIDLVVDVFVDPDRTKDVPKAELDGLTEACTTMRSALIEARALWGRDAIGPVIRLDGYAHLFETAMRGRWKYGEIPAYWVGVRSGDAEARKVVDSHVTKLLADVEVWAEPFISRRPWWKEANRDSAGPRDTAEEVAALLAGLPKQLKE